MNRFILVVALAAACSSPAFAGLGKAGQSRLQYLSHSAVGSPPPSL
jgi:hypothetical protein